MRLYVLILLSILGLTLEAQNCILEDSWKDCYETTAMIGDELNLCTYDDFILVYEDEFEKLDTRMWTGSWHDHCIGQNPNEGTPSIAYFGNSIDEMLELGNLAVRNGNLEIITKKKHIETTCYVTKQPETFEYTSGWIRTRFRFNHGQFKARVKVPAAKGYGLNPAFWLWDDQTVHDQNFKNEIDIFEFLDHEEGLFWDGTEDPVFSSHRWNDDGTHEACIRELNCDGQFVNTYKEYCLLWTPREFSWQIDGTEVLNEVFYYTMDGREVGCNLNLPKTLQIHKAAAYNPVMIILNNQVHDSENPDGNMPNVMYIDYLKIYSYVNCLGNGKVDAFDIGPSGIANIFAGDQITIEGDVKLGDNESLFVVANEEIILEPGFELATNSYLSLRIDTNVCTE